jgi:hypothetical protein
MKKKMANKYMKNISTTLAIGKMKIKSTYSTSHSNQSGYHQENCCEDAGGKECLYTASGNINYSRHYKKSV